MSITIIFISSPSIYQLLSGAHFSTKVTPAGWRMISPNPVSFVATFTALSSLQEHLTEFTTLKTLFSCFYDKHTLLFSSSFLFIPSQYLLYMFAFLTKQWAPRGRDFMCGSLMTSILECTWQALNQWKQKSTLHYLFSVREFPFPCEILHIILILWTQW